MIIAEYIYDGWLKQENWTMQPHEAKEQARKLLGTRQVDYILLVDTDRRQKIMYIQRGAR